MSLQYIRRSTSELIDENPPGEGFLKFLYGGNPLGKLTLEALLKRKFLTELAGRFMNSARSQKRIQKFIEAQNLDMSDYEVPQSGFKTFNDFFYRKVKNSSRPIGEGIVSPADGKILVFNKIKDSLNFFVKGLEFNLKTYFKDEEVSSLFNEGAMTIIRLAPIDYHRYHFPVGGRVGENIRLSGNYYSVSPLALRKNLRIFCENQRTYSLTKTEDMGVVAMSEVAATMVGSMIDTYKPNSVIQKGDEKGYFAFGGSTVVLFFQKDRIHFDSDLIQNTNNGLETEIKMGEKIASTQ